MQFESEIDVRAEVLSSTQAYDQLGVEPSNLRTELLVSEATEVTQTLSSSDDSVTSTIRQLSSETVVEYEDRVNDGSYKRSEAEELIIGTTEQFRHSEINEKQTAAQDSIGVTITATADDSSVTTSTSTATSTSTEDDIMLYSNADVNGDINTLRQNTRPSSNLSHSNDKEELVHDMAVDTTVDPMPIDTLIIKNTYNDDNTHKRTLNNDSDIDDDDNDNGNDDDSSTSNSSDINSINTKEIQSDHKSNLQTEREIITDDDYIDEVVEGAVVNDGDVDVDDGKNDNLKNHDSVNIEGKHRIGSDNRVSNGIKNDDNNNENNTNSDKNDHYDDEYEGDDDMNNDSKKDDDHDSGTNKNTNQESSSSDNDDHSYTDYHDTDTTTDNDDYSDSNDISIDNNNNDDSTNNKNIDDDNDVKNTIGTSSTHNNTSTNNHINSNKNTNTRTKTNTKTNEEVSHTALSASLDSRIKRLSILMKERKDLVDDYNIHQMGKETIMNAMNRHIMKSMQHRPLLPSSDSACSWNYWKERYVHLWLELTCMYVRCGEHLCVHVCMYALIHIRRRFINYSFISTSNFKTILFLSQLRRLQLNLLHSFFCFLIVFHHILHQM